MNTRRRKNATLLSARKNVSSSPLSQGRRRVLAILLGLYSLAIAVMCFSPQVYISGVKTPGIVYLGRVPVLLTPFNSLLRLSEIKDTFSLLWILGQNLANVLLLYPFFLLVFYLYPNLSSCAKAWRLGLTFSLLIETGQILLDIFFDFNRVFEIDDLWTNTLGAVLAALTYGFLTRNVQEKQSKK